MCISIRLSVSISLTLSHRKNTIIQMLGWWLPMHRRTWSPRLPSTIAAHGRRECWSPQERHATAEMILSDDSLTEHFKIADDALAAYEMVLNFVVPSLCHSMDIRRMPTMDLIEMAQSESSNGISRMDFSQFPRSFGDYQSISIMKWKSRLFVDHFSRTNSQYE